MTESLVVAWRKLSGLFKRQRRDKIDLRLQVADEASSNAGLSRSPESIEALSLDLCWRNFRFGRSTTTGVALGRTGVRAIAAIPLRARRRFTAKADLRSSRTAIPRRELSARTCGFAKGLPFCR